MMDEVLMHPSRLEHFALMAGAIARAPATCDGAENPPRGAAPYNSMERKHRPSRHDD
jgi:hypothetical protein